MKTSTRTTITALLLLGSVTTACTTATTGSTTGSATGSTGTGIARTGTTGTGAGTATTAGRTGTTVDPAAALPALALRVVENATGATKYGYEGPSSITAGNVLVQLTNGGTEEHQAGVGRLKDGVTYEQLDQAVAANPELAAGLLDLRGGSAAVGPGAVGKSIVSVTPGKYVVFCFVADATGQPHLAHGMIHRFEATPGAGAGTTVAPPPIAVAGTITLQDFGILLPDDFTGKGWYEVRNVGRQLHEALGYELAAGVTPKDFDTYMRTYAQTGQPPAGPPPYTAATGPSAASSGTTQWVHFDLDPAKRYVFVCGIPDFEKGLTPHFMEGMVTYWPEGS